MYNVVLVIQCVSIAILLFESMYVFFNLKTKGQSYLFLYCVAALINNIAYLFVMRATTMREAQIGSQLSYVGKIWIPISFFIMVMELSEIKLSKKIYYCLIPIHIFVLFLVLTSENNYLYYSHKREFVYDGLFPHNSFGHTPIYNAYTFLCFLYVLVGVVAIVWKYIRNRDKYMRKLYLYILASIIAMAAGLLAYIVKITNGYDSTSLGYAISSAILFVAIFKFKLMDTLTIVKDYVADTITEGIIATDNSGKVIYYNEPIKDIFDDIENDPKSKVLYIEQCEMDGEIIRKNDRIYESVSKPLLRGNMVMGCLHVISDVTVRYKHMEELQEQKDIAEEANASKSAFLSVVTHEIRTPMSAIVGMTDLILREPENLTDKQVKYLKNIKNSGDSLVMIANDILDQSKIEAGKMEIIEDAYELEPLVEDVKMIIENRIGGKPIHLISEIDEEIPKCLNGDSLRIRQILINLMNNAVKFTEEGYIRLKIECVEIGSGKRKLRFSVKDSGQGIKPEDLSKLGQAFIQVDAKRNHHKEGTGLGLSISKDFIAMMGGQLEVTSEYGKGTEFFFTIWQGVASSMDVNAASGVAGKQAWQDEEQFIANDAKVLVVDDTDFNLLIMEELLKPIGVKVTTANSGDKAIELVKANRYDVIFMDYMMPYMDGTETTEKIRAGAKDENNTEEQKEYFKSVPIVALSGDDSDDTKEKFLRAGIDDFTVKPVDIKRLKRLLVKWLPNDLIKPV